MDISPIVPNTLDNFMGLRIGVRVISVNMSVVRLHCLQFPIPVEQTILKPPMVLMIILTMVIACVDPLPMIETAFKLPLVRHKEVIIVPTWFLFIDTWPLALSTSWLHLLPAFDLD